MTPMKAIRAKCLDCTGGQPKEVRQCAVPKCPLYVYRFGKRPKVGNDAGADGCGEKSAACPVIFTEESEE